jgi:thiol-disulfide isomerase/thioredoxin
MKILKFGAIWCPGCIVMRSRWQTVETENDWLKTAYFDIDEYPEMKDKYGLTEYPTFIWLDQNEQELDRLTGEVSEEQILDFINKYKEK